ncbi:DEAD/DEAH box helicase [Armatimonas rosea]|uniref:AAA+ ATPase domain-containing protein n=1 Tax=Armatimonas rosea TaxID=685828 RepID=A0A7W9SWY8_ARMRO|nr:AAA domain-containing protein [Armatimonas rosea]MBB6053890.1 hypothetical protein [Armatimonas rosea]
MNPTDVPGREERTATLRVILGEMTDQDRSLTARFRADEQRAEGTLQLPDGREVMLVAERDNTQANEFLVEARRYGFQALYEVVSVSGGDRKWITLRQRAYLSCIYLPEDTPLLIDLSDDVLREHQLDGLSPDALAGQLAVEFLAAQDGRAITRPQSARMRVPDDLLHGPHLAFFTLLERPGVGSRPGTPFSTGSGIRLWARRRAADLMLEEGILRCVRIFEHRTLREDAARMRLLQGYIRFGTGEHLARIRSQTRKAVLESLTRPHSYLAGWGYYLELERRLVFEEAANVGTVRYHSYKLDVDGDGLRLEFKLTTPLPEGFLGRALDLDAAAEAPDRDDSGHWRFPPDLKRAGTMERADRQTSRLITYLDYQPDFESLPPEQNGFLMLSLIGDERRMERRSAALETVSGGAVSVRPKGDPRLVGSRLATLGELLETGRAGAFETRSRDAAVTTALREHLGRDLTRDQREALDIALNTPDIALIQGPPGTGKTTVIRALVLRLMERAQERGEQMRVLVTSYQHDAVDNAIQGLEVNGLPPQRVGGKSGLAHEERHRQLYKWIEDRKKYCDGVLEQLPDDPLRARARELAHRLDRYRFDWDLQDPRALPAAVALAEETLLTNAGHISLSRTEAVRDVCQKAHTHSIQAAAALSVFPDSEDANLKSRLNALLAQQRVLVEAFADDGQFQADRLRRFLSRNGAYLGGVADREDIHNALQAVAMQQDTPPDSETWEAYVRSIRILQGDDAEENGEETSQTTAERPLTATILEQLDAIVDDLLDSAQAGYGAIADAVQYFREEIGDLARTRRMVEEYGSITAGTCQQIAEQATEYDFVIIDEAARAMPLDLLIPMVRGRRIVLVGDHQQLPQILEDQAVQEYSATKGVEDAAMLQQSLFQRLYEIFTDPKRNEGQPRRAFRLRTGFRMHPVISRLVSEQFYDNDVEAGCSADERDHGLPLYGGKPLVWLDIPRSRGGESRGQSKTRQVEVDAVVVEAERILKHAPQYTIGIIAYYERQAALLRTRIRELPLELSQKIEVGTVDSFQGKEFDVVLLSTVRSNGERSDDEDARRRRVGFLSLKNRLCVSLSRARRLLIVCGDAETVAPPIPALDALYRRCLGGEEGWYISYA